MSISLALATAVLAAVVLSGTFAPSREDGTKLTARFGILPDVAAQTTLYIPGADPQPITASVLGVGSGGETTWLLGPGVSSGTLEDIGIPGPGMAPRPCARSIVAHNSCRFSHAD